jgi:hypothetical protein
MNHFDMMFVSAIGGENAEPASAGLLTSGPGFSRGWAAQHHFSPQLDSSRQG